MVWRCISRWCSTYSDQVFSVNKNQFVGSRECIFKPRLHMPLTTGETLITVTAVTDSKTSMVDWYIVKYPSLRWLRGVLCCPLCCISMIRKLVRITIVSQCRLCNEKIRPEQFQQRPVTGNIREGNWAYGAKQESDNCNPGHNKHLLHMTILFNESMEC